MILIIDDELFRLDPLIATVQNEGIELKTIDNGTEGIEFVSKRITDLELIIIDLMIPYSEKSLENNYPGIELIVDIQKINSDLPIIAFTNVSKSEIHEILKNLGVKETIVKMDVSPSEFVEIIKKYLK